MGIVQARSRDFALREERSSARSVLRGGPPSPALPSLLAQGSTHMDRSARPSKRFTRAPYAERAFRHRALR
jgi:hypothetical protein